MADGCCLHGKRRRNDDYVCANQLCDERNAKNPPHEPAHHHSTMSAVTMPNIP